MFLQGDRHTFDQMFKSDRGQNIQQSEINNITHRTIDATGSEV